MKPMDLNADVGEHEADAAIDAALMPWVTSVNVACGAHAGGPAQMRACVALAAAQGVAIGAHPGFADRAGFGRRPMPNAGPADVEALVQGQLAALAAIAAEVGLGLRHVKVHGALANQSARDAALALAIGRAIAAFDARMLWLVPVHSEQERAGLALGIAIVREGYVDRGYGEDGHLLARDLPGALLGDPVAAADRALTMVRDQCLVTTSGARLPATIDSLCVHGDGPLALDMLRAVRVRLCAAGVPIAAPCAPQRPGIVTHDVPR